MNYIEQIAISSPWWNDEVWHITDRNIKAAKSSKLNFRHLPEGIKIKASAIDIIRGPRQIGKTTEIKLIINELINKKTNPKAIGFFSCDIISKPKDLFEVLKSFYQHLKINKIKKGLFALDEISSVKDWQKAVKNFVDLGMAERIHLVLTGSSSIELKRGYERMPGRRNGGKDYLFLPLSFYEFCRLVNYKGSIVEEKFSGVIASQRNFDEFKNNALMKADFYRANLRNYFKIGGFLRAVSDFVKEGDISQETLLIYQSVLFSEFEKYRKNLSMLMRVVSEIMRNIATPVSFNAIMKNIEFSSANTVKEYVEMLNMAYLGLEILCLDISKKQPFNKKNKKMYFIDPIIFRILSDKFHVQYPGDDKIAENVCAVHVSKFFLSEWASFGVLNKVFYWKSKKGNEIDFVILKNNKPFGFEVKYQNTVSAWDEISIKKGIGDGIIVSKDTFEYGQIPKIPLWAFLLLKI
ncbi:MAG: ATP-binding protein [Elusimicrobia bacterium]|nr:ATP-binding protein [Elusimicrobiota bacterium]